MNYLKALQDWYKSNCDGDWEHCYGIKIDTLDNPGWAVEINLVDTKWENKDFQYVQIQRKYEDDWIHCKVESNVFYGCGGPDNLEEILRIFYEWSLNL